MTTQELRNPALLQTITELMEANEKRCGTIAESTALMHTLMSAVRKAGGKGGNLILNFAVAPDKNDELALTIDCAVTLRAPPMPRRKAIVYHDEENMAFTKTDPRQLELLAEQEAERQDRARELSEAGIARIGRGEPAIAAG